MKLTLLLVPVCVLLALLPRHRNQDMEVWKKSWKNVGRKSVFLEAEAQ